MEEKINARPKYTPTVSIKGARFDLGQLFSTPGALEALEPNEMHAFLRRHVTGDWGDCCPLDRNANDDALEHGGRLFSFYHTARGEKIWLITEADRTVSTFLLPSEY